MSTLDFNVIAELVEQVKNNNTESFTKLYNVTYKSVYYFALSITKNKDMSLDITQEVYILVYINIQLLKNNRLFMSWIHKITYHQSLKALSQEEKHPTPIENINELASNDKYSLQDEPLNIILKNEQATTITKYITLLKEEYRSVIIMKYFHSMKIQEIAYIMDCPEGTIKSRLHNAKKQLKILMKNDNKMFSLNIFIPLYTYSLLREPLTNILQTLDVIPNYIQDNTLYSLEDNILTKSLHNVPAPPASASHNFFMTCLISTGLSGIVIITGLMGLTVLFPPQISKVYSTLATDKSYATIHIETKHNPIAKKLYIKPQSEIHTLVKEDINKYSINVDRNHKYTIYLKGFSKKSKNASINITDIDTLGPKIKNYSVTKDKLRIHFSSDPSGIDYSTIYLDKNGTSKKPTAINEAKNYVEFTIQEGSYTLYSSDSIGNISENKIIVKPIS